MKKKKNVILLIIVLLVFILIMLSTQVYRRFNNKLAFENDYLNFAEKNEKTVFSINRCVFFNNCNAKTKTNSNSGFTIENLYQYTDIALFINTNSNEKNLENTLKSVKINNLQFITKPEIGNQKIFYKNINSFAKNIALEKNAFENELVFDITSNDKDDLDNPVLYNNCANPIVLSYTNDNLKTDYAIADASNTITYDGSLLKRCGITLNSLSTKFSFDIYITNNLEQEFKCTVFIEPPIENVNKSLYDGAITTTQNTNYNFFRYK